MVLSIIHTLFGAYTILLVMRMVSTWVPAWSHTRFVQFLIFYTEPYLGIFRRILPPIGGVLDLSPMIAFLALRILESFLLGLLS